MLYIPENIFIIVMTRAILLRLRVLMRTYAANIPLLRRRSRCFARSIETLRAVVEVFVDAYNKFGIAKLMYREHYPKGNLPFGLVDFL